MFLHRCKNGRPSGEDFRSKILSWAGPLARPLTRKTPFLACQKSSLPCKNAKMGFLGEKACIFGQFVHNFAQKWPLFCGHSPPLQGCQSVGKKPANLYSTKCRIFGPRTPACGTVVGHQFLTPSHGSWHPFCQKHENVFSQNTEVWDRMSLWHFLYNYIMKYLYFINLIRDFRFWRIAPRRQHIRTSAEVGSLK